MHLGCIITLVHEEECAFGYMSICMSVRTRNSKTFATIDLICLDSRIYLRILHHYEIGQNMPRHQKCVMKTCVMTSRVRHSERGSVISDCLVYIMCRSILKCW